MSNSEKLPLPSPSRADLRTDGSPDSEKIEHSARKHKCETLRAWSKSKTGMSAAKVEQQSTETLSFRCWCERCRLTRGRRVKQSRATELGWGEGTNLNSTTIEQLKEPNDVIYPVVSIAGAQVCAPYSDYHQAVTTSETQNDHSQERTSGQILKQVQDDYILRGRRRKVGCAHLRTAKNFAGRRKVAFTLAEVLITLGIIGVVAALTLPALLTNIQSKVRAERSRSVQYKFSLATEKMARLNLIGPYDSTDAFVDELQKHLKISKRCNASNLRGCWPYDTVDLGNGKTWDISKTKTGKQLGMNTDDDNDYTSDNVGIVTADGTPMILSYNKKCKAIDSLEKLSWSTTDNKPLTNPSASCVAAVYEINGTGKPNKLSNDVVLFNANKLGNACAIELNGKCFGAPFAPNPLTKAECEAEKGNLGIKACYYDDDYWAGAVKQCGGVSKMPTADDLAKLASQLYKGNPSIGAKENEGGFQWDQDAATVLGFNSSEFKLWSGEEDDRDGVYSNGAYVRHFGSTVSYWNANGRGDGSNVQAVCLGE